MPIVRVGLPVYLPRWLHQPLRGVKRAIFPAKPMRRTIWGERHIEWSFISSMMPSGPGNALDFGCEFGYLSLLAAFKGFRVVAVDLEAQAFPWQDSNVQFVQGDLLRLVLPENHFDLIINCSSVEHVGLAGRYGVTQDFGDGDLQVMERLYVLLKPNGMLLMTAPCGRDAVFAPWHRVYGADRLPRLLGRYLIETEAFWIKDSQNRWIPCDRQTALDLMPTSDPADPHNSLYSLGCFVLRKPAGAGHNGSGR